MPDTSAKILFGLLLCLINPLVSADVTLMGNLKKWYPVTIDLDEPTLTTDETADSPNPFLDVRYNVHFISPSGNRYRVPGFYAGDGEGGSAGSVWRARFSPDEAGVWTYTISFRSGAAIAVDLNADSGTPLSADGESATFTVTDRDVDAPGFLSYGRLEYNGSHYLKFADGPYWIKGGVDSPENFFGFAGFDNTVDQAGGASTGKLVDGVHHYEPHIADWLPGDPEFVNSETGESGKGIIGAINYLSSEGVNSIYFLPMNLGGDGRETYPFISPDGSHDANTHYDVSKLYQWNSVLEHMQNRGIAAHIVLAETETGNTNWFDDGELGVQRKLYYRELVARFGYLLAIKWNISEESKFGTERHQAFAAYLRNIDWAKHQISVHSLKDQPAAIYTDLLGNTDFDATSIQYSAEKADKLVEEWRSLSRDAGWPWVIDMDEVGPGSVGLSDKNTDELRKQALYPIYFSGGNLEWYFGYKHLPLGGDMRTEDFRTRESMYRYMRYAREWMIAELPFWEMEPNDSLHSLGDTTGVQVFEKPGAVYAVYLPDGTVGGELSVVQGDYSVQWFNPRSGESVGAQRLIRADSISIGLPPSSATEDWVMLVKAVESVTPEPKAGSSESNSEPGEPASNVGDAPVLGQASGEPVGTPTSESSGTGSSNIWVIVGLAASRVLRRRRSKPTACQQCSCARFGGRA